MTTQPEALRLADDLAKYLGGNTATQAAAELRRLAVQRDALLEACKTLVALPGTEDWAATLRLAVEQARAAIKAVEEGK